MNKRIIKILSMLLFVFVTFSFIKAEGKDEILQEAINEAHRGNMDFAFMKFRDYLRDHPQTIYTKDIKFAIAEYYLQIRDYQEGITKLIEFIDAYPNTKSVIFAQALLYQAILEYKDDPELAKNVKENFFSNPVFLIFSQSKTRNYTSFFNNKYKLIDYVDRVEILKNNVLFLEIAP